MGAEWSPEEDADLFRMWMVEGHSAGFIAKAIPSRSRNAVIGRVFRMGWKRAEPADAGKRLPYPGSRYSAPSIERKTGRGNSPGSRASLSIGQRKSAPKGNQPVDLKPCDTASPNAGPWFERAARQCAYPVSGEGADIWSCCNPTEATYCPGHVAVMFAGTPKINTKGVETSERRSRPKASISDDIFAKWAA